MGTHKVGHHIDTFSRVEINHVDAVLAQAIPPEKLTASPTITLPMLN